MRCDLLEAWFRRYGERSICPNLVLMAWMAKLLEEGLPGERDSWPLLADAMTALAAYYRKMQTSADAMTHIAGSHILAATLAAELWVNNGCPRVRLDPQLASALMLTDSSKAELSDDLPWTAFVISVPERTLSYRYTGREPTWVESLMVAQSGGVLMIHLIGAEPSTPFSIAWAQTLEGLLAARDSWQQHAVTADMAVNLVRGVLLQIQAGNLHQETRPVREGRSGHRWRRPGELPDTTDFVLGTNVPLKQDYVAAVRSIAAGTKRYGKVQWMVRGHKRWQACGIRHQDRKLIWVVPYWKGEVDAPILHRDHVIEESK